jgi:hypothetical protein
VLLRFFRINDPYRLLGVLAFLIVMSLPFFIYPAATTVPELKSFVLGEAISRGRLLYIEVIDYTAPMAAGAFGAADWLFGRSVIARQTIVLFLIFFQAAFFAILLINNKAYNDNTYVPALIFAGLCIFSFDMFSFSPELLASTVLVLALNFLFKEIEFRHERDEIILNLGACLGVSTLFIFSYIIFLLATIVILFIFTRPSIRKVLLLLFGFVLPHALLVTIYYFLGETTSLWHGFYEANLTIHGEVWITFKAILILSAIPPFYFVLSLFMLNREARFTKYQSQLFQVMFLWMLAGLVQVLVTRELSPHTLIIFIPSLAYFISHFILLVRRKWISETMLWTFFIGILTIALLARYGKIDAVKYGQLFQKQGEQKEQIKNKRVMIVGDDFGIYLHNQLAGYFLDWGLSRKVLEHPDYYENVIQVYNSLRQDPPDVIIDPNDLMKSFFRRIPELQLKYKRVGDQYRKI